MVEVEDCFEYMTDEGFYMVERDSIRGDDI